MITQIYFLMGLPAVGKSYWANIWANENNLEYCDLDRLIEQEEKKTISAIFEEFGEPYFRKSESVVLKKKVTASKNKALIIAVGGGTPCFNNNLKYMNKTGCTIWLDDSLNSILKRIKKNNSRPLFNGIDIEKLKTLSLTRAKFYNQAMFKIEVSKINKSTFVEIQNTWLKRQL